MYVCFEWSSVVGLLMVLGLVSGQDDILLGQQNGLMVSVSKKGAHIRVSRQLRSPVPFTTPLPTNASVSSNSTAATPPTPGPVPTTGEILIYFAAVREVDSDGVEVKQSNGAGREFTSFDSQNFNVTQASNSQIPNSQPPIIADTMSLTLNLPTPPSGVFKAVASVTRVNGSVTSGDEVMTLAWGQLEMCVELDGWQWCDSGCPNSKPSVFLEVDVVVQLPSGRTIKAQDGQTYGRPKRYLLGGDAYADFSTKVSVDQSWRNLTSGYPKLTVAGSKNTLTVRLPRFNSSAIYNAVFDPGFQSNDNTVVGCASDLRDVSVHLLLAVAMVTRGVGLLA